MGTSAKAYLFNGISAFFALFGESNPGRLSTIRIKEK